MAMPARNAELCRLPYIREQLLEIYEAVEKGYQAQIERSDKLCDYWDAWNCKLGTNQFYAGNSKVYVPLVRNAIKALRTRFTGQLFPVTGRHVTVISHDDEQPDALIALMEHYIRRADLRSLVIPALVVCGQVEGMYTLLVTWSGRKRSTIERIPEPIRVLGLDLPEEFGTVLRTREEEIEDAGPDVEVILDADLCVTPPTADNPTDAIEQGGSVSVLRRYSKTRLKQLIEEGEFDAEGTEELIDAMATYSLKNIAKSNLQTIGIQQRGGLHAAIARTWCKIEVGRGRDKEKRLVLAYFAGPNHLLSCRLCPYWNDKIDIISQPLDKLPFNFKGMSQLQPGVCDMQYYANDALNEGLDQLTYTLLPPVLYDPEKVPNVDALILDLQAMWAAPPGSVQPFQFQNTIALAFEAVAGAERYINMSLSVAPGMIPQSTGRKKLNQAEVALEQQVALETTSDEVTSLESGIMNPLMQFFADLDAQFRDREKTVRAFGEMGLKVEMVTVPPIQQGNRWEYLWFGVEANRTVQQVQQQIAAANVLRGLAQDPSVQLAGKRLNMVPIIQSVVEAAFSPRLAPRIFEDVREQSTVDPQLENQMLAQGLRVHTMPLDNDPQHQQIHQQLLQQLPPGSLAHSETLLHLGDHQRQMQMKAQAQAQAMMGQMMGGPGGQMPAQPGSPRPSRGGGPPRLPMPGGQPAMPRQGRQPQGRIAPDNMTQSGLIPFPRRA